MNRTPLVSALALLVLAAGLLFTATRANAAFAPMWARTGWDYVQNAGNTDGDPQDELLVSSKVDGHYALLDASSGVIEWEFTQFKVGEVTGLIIQNVDGDARRELIFSTIPAAPPAFPLVKGFKWTAGSYVTMFLHAEAATSISLVHLRGASQVELLERSANDVAVFDMAGTELLRASHVISPWSGVDPFFLLDDLDGDGTDEIGIIQRTNATDVQTLFFHYNSGFVYTWSATSWFMVGAFQTDGDAQAEVLGANRIDGRYAFFDGTTGASALELPEFTTGNFSTVSAIDVNGDGRQEIFATRPASPGFTALTRAYQWVSGSYVQMYSYSQEPLSFNLAHTRNVTQSEFVNVTLNDIFVRDPGTGVVLFRASTQLAGWSGAGLNVNFSDADHDGVLEFLIQDGNTLRFVRYMAGAYTQLWSSTAWQYPSPTVKLDNQPLNGLIAYSTSDGRLGLLDPFTGAVRVDFPGFLQSQGVRYYPADFAHDGISSLMLYRSDFPGPYVATSYRWNGSTYATQFSHAQETSGELVGSFRSLASSELLEIASTNGDRNDVRVRDSNGQVLFRATDTPGWTDAGVPPTLDTLDIEHDGIKEFLAIDGAAIRLVKFVGALDVPAAQGGPALRLSANVPNPFRTSTALRFSTSHEGLVKIAIFDASGRLVRRLDQHLAAGQHEVKWDGRDTAGHTVASGMLFYEIRTAGVSERRKLVRIGD